MDGSDLNHAAIEIDEKIESHSAHSSKSFDKETSPNDKEHKIHDSGSSTQDSNAVHKLDSTIKVKEVKEGDELYAHLPEHEREIVKRQLDIPPISVSFTTLFRYATRNDQLIISLSAFCAIAGGAALPLMTVSLKIWDTKIVVFRTNRNQVIFGQLAGSFQTYYNGLTTQSEFSHILSHYTLYFIYLAIAEFVAIYIATVGFSYSGEHMTQKIREQYLAAILRQNIAFFDKLGAGEITTRITSDTNLVQDGISQKIGLTLTAFATFVTAFIIGFIKYWRLTLIMTSTMFAIVFIMGIGSRFIVKNNKKSLASYALGGTVAEEVISSIRNTTAFSTQDKLARQYDVHLTEAEEYGFKVKRVLAIMIAGLMGIVRILDSP